MQLAVTRGTRRNFPTLIYFHLVTSSAFLGFPVLLKGEARCGFMKKRLGLLNRFANAIVQTAKVRRKLIGVLAALFLLQFYFVRELLAVELFFALAFAVVLVLGGPAYLIVSANLTWLEQPRRSPSKATPALGHTGSFDDGRLAPGTLGWVPGRGEKVDAVEP